MARSCGIRLGPRRFELVVLDGGPKKHRIVGWHAEVFEDPDPSSTEARAKQLAAALAEVKAPRDNARLVVDSGVAAFRRVTVPFSDPAKIEQVLKFEIEGELPQFSIDDVVVDHHVLNSNDQGADLLCVAVPKKDLQASLDLCEAAGVEALDAELETSAMVNAALASGLCSIEDAQLLVHVGDRATAVVVVDAGEVREMRVIHIGAHSHETEDAPVGEDSGEEDPTPETPEAAAERELETSRRAEQAIKRIRRELGRTLSAARTIHPISAIHACGAELPGLIGESVQEVPVYVLDCFEEDSGQPADGFGQLVAAYGGALAGLEAAAMPGHLRREELKFTGTWERLEFPLAIATMLIATLLGVVNIFQHRELTSYEQYGARWYLQSVNSHVFGDLKKGKRGYLYPVPDASEDAFLAGFQQRFEGANSDWEGDDYDALARLAAHLGTANRNLEKSLGTLTDFTQPQSAFTAATLVLSVLDDNMDKWRPSLRRIQAVYQPSRSNKQDDSVKVTLDLVFFAADTVEASRHYEAFLAEVSGQPWHVEHQERSSKDLTNGQGVLVEGLPITVNVDTWLKANGEGGANQ
jgi:Tfp pilus assembly PilM family ATPase